MQYNTIDSIRSIQHTNQIEALRKLILNHSAIDFFVHDISYGKGQFSILSNSSIWLKSYYQNLTIAPAFYTNEVGRALPNGVYVFEDLPMSENESHKLNTLKLNFGFHQMVSIVEHEGDIQNTYSFSIRCNQKQFLFFMLNHLKHLQRFIAIYRRQFGAAIEHVKEEKEHLILPYSLDKPEELSLFLDTDAESCFSNNHYLQIPHALTQEIVSLTKQQAHCFMLLLQGLSAREIALRMGLSYRTVQNYTAMVYEHLGLANSRELISHYAYLKL